MKTLIRAIGVLLLILLSGCASTAIKPEVAGGIKRIGVLPMMPTDIKYSKIGITVFSNETISKYVGGDFNNSAYEAARNSLLASNPNREVIRINDDKGVLSKKYYTQPLVMGELLSNIKPELLSFAKSNNLDAIVLFAESHDPSDGIFVYFDAGISSIKDVRIISKTYTVVIDANGKEMASILYPSFFEVSKSSGISDWNYGLADNLTADFNDRMKVSIQEILSNAVSGQLRDIGLGGK